MPAGFQIGTVQGTMNSLKGCHRAMAGDSAMLTGVKGPVHAMLPAAIPVPSALPCAMKRHAVWYEDCTSMLAAPLNCTFCMQQGVQYLQVHIGHHNARLI